MFFLIIFVVLKKTNNRIMLLRYLQSRIILTVIALLMFIRTTGNVIMPIYYIYLLISVQLFTYILN